MKICWQGLAFDSLVRLELMERETEPVGEGVLRRNVPRNSPPLFAGRVNLCLRFILQITLFSVFRVQDNFGQ